MDSKKILGQRIKFLRDKAGITQKDLAKRMAVSLPTVQNIEYGEQWPRAEAFDRLAKIFGVEPWQLLKSSELHSSPADDISLLADIFADISRMDQSQLAPVVAYLKAIARVTPSSTPPTDRKRKQGSR